jgi:hypothetical protein
MIRVTQQTDAMKFLSAAECKAYARRMGSEKSVLDRREIGHMKRVIDFTYLSRLQNGGPVATALACCLGSFTSALLWTHGLVWGDRTQDPDAPADWMHYGRWRAQLGATGPLFELPGQLFDATERTELAKAIEWTIYTGSDAVILTRPTRVTVHLSHDDLISIHCRSAPSGLRALEGLGLQRTR